MGDMNIYANWVTDVNANSDNMMLDEYQRLAARTIGKDFTFPMMEGHALYGMASEVGELHGLYQKAYQGHKLDEDHRKKEVGDLLWFISEYCTSQGWRLGEIAKLNVDKLKARYPDGFSEDKSLHRAEGDV